MSFNQQYFQQTFGVVMGTNVAPILANIYLAMLEKELHKNADMTLHLNGQYFSSDLLMMVSEFWGNKKRIWRHGCTFYEHGKFDIRLHQKAEKQILLFTSSWIILWWEIKFWGVELFHTHDVPLKFTKTKFILVPYPYLHW